MLTCICFETLFIFKKMMSFQKDKNEFAVVKRLADQIFLLPSRVLQKNRAFQKAKLLFLHSHRPASPARRGFANQFCRSNKHMPKLAIN